MKFTIDSAEEQIPGNYKITLAAEISGGFSRGRLKTKNWLSFYINLMYL